MQFSQITGLTDIKNRLIQAVQHNHVAHALLFHGAAGSGNLAMALAFATFINCEDKQAEDACGKCANCLKMSKLAHPDVNYIFPTAGGKSVISENFIMQWRAFIKENIYGSISDWLEKINIKQGNIPVEEARQLLQKMSLKSYEGGYKIVMIWQAEMLHPSTANALLKILEEPPEKTLFLLVCSNSDRLLTTIISRTQRIAVRAFNDEEVISYILKSERAESHLITYDRAKQIAFLAEGNLAKVQEIMNKADENEHVWFANWMRMCYALNVQKLVPMADEFDALPKEKQKGILEYGMNIFREIFLFRNGLENLIRLEGEDLIFVQKFAKALNINNLEQIIKELSDAHFHLERNARAKMLFLDISLSIGQMMK
jgi:DNA polymerase III subunit delta'